jgi:hypothetical protein
MDSPETADRHEHNEDLSPAKLFTRFEALGKQLETAGAPGAEHEGEDIDDQFRLNSGETVHIGWARNPILDRNSGILHSGSMVVDDPESDSAVCYNFARQLGDIGQPTKPLITTYEEVSDGESGDPEGRDLSTDLEVLGKINTLLTGLEAAVAFRIANPIELIPVAEPPASA